MKACLPTKWESAELNNWAFNHYFYSLLDIAVNSYNWINLPSEIDPRFLEYCVNVNGYALFSYDDVALQNGIKKAHGFKTLSKMRFERLRKLYAPYCSVASVYYYAYNDDKSGWYIE